MSHLSREQLSAMADGALTGRALERADDHLAGCRECRDEVARIAAEDAALASALEHDPGDAYFESFADRVAERIAQDPARAPLPARASREPWWTPARIAMAGGLASLAVAAGIVGIIARQQQPELLTGIRPSAPPPMVSESAPPAAAQEQALEPPASTPMAETDRMAAPLADAPKAEAEASAPAAGAAPGRAYEVRAGAGDEVVRVTPPSAFERARRANAPPPVAKEGEAVRADKARQAQPLAPAPVQELAVQSEVAQAGRDGATARVCGTVVDDRGRVVSGALVQVIGLGLSAASDHVGRFCLEVPRGERTLQVYAVGFQPLKRTLTLTPEGSGELAFALRPVAVLDPSLALGGQAAPRDARAKAGAPTTSLAPGAAPAAPPLGALNERLRAREEGARESAEPALQAFAGQPDSVLALAREAQLATAGALARRTAAAFDQAALRWDRVVQKSQGAAEVEARRRAAEARFHAWETAPSTRRALAAEEALTAYLVRAPAGAAREQAAVWLDRVKH